MSEHLNFLNSFIQRIGRAQADKKSASPEEIIDQCHQLVSKNSEATSFSLATIILEDFSTLKENQKKEFFLRLLDQFSVDRSKLKQAISTLNISDEKQLRTLHNLTEPKSQELLRRLNQVPNGTAVLLKMRESLFFFKQKTAYEIST